MKRVFVLSLLATVVLSAVAFAGPSINPYVEIENVGIMAQPTLVAGAVVEGDLATAWAMDFGVEYTDGNLLDRDNPFGLSFTANIYFDEYATINQTGSLTYGCSLSFNTDSTYKVNAYPDRIKLKARTTGIMLEGYVGPLTLWGGVDFPWDGSVWLDFVPTFGARVDFDIDL